MHLRLLTHLLPSLREVPIGMAICDVALAHLAYHRAVERGIGTRFALT